MPHLPTIDNGHVDGVAESFAERGPGDSVDPSGTLVLRGCRWRGPGIITYDLSWDAAAGTSYPLAVRIWLFQENGDIARGAQGDVTLRSAGAFSVTLTQHGPPNFAQESTEPCAASARKRVFDQHATPSIDPLPSDAVAPAGTVDALLQHIDFMQSDIPLLPLAYLFAGGDVPTIDRLFLAPDRHLSSITAQQQGPCIEILSSYDPGNSVRQSIRCAAGGYAGATVTVPDDVWKVEVSSASSEPDEAFLRDLRSIPFAHVKPFTKVDARFDPDALLDAMLHDTDRHEIARLRWRDGIVAPIEGHSDWGPDYVSSIVVVQDRAPERTGVGGATPCRDYTTSIEFGTDTHQGFAYAVSSRPDDRFTVTTPGQSPIEIRMTPAAHGLRAGLVDLTDLPIGLETTINVIDATGQAVPCVQSR